jgi:general secretion pathway protein F
MLYKVKAVSGREIISFDITANTEQEALSQVKTKGLIPISVKVIKSEFYRIKQHRFSVSLFTLELLALLDAGLNLVEAVEALVYKNDVQQPVLTKLLNSMYEGQTFSAALGQQSETFPILFMATVKASEKTGDLQESLKLFIEYQKKIDQLKKNVISSSIYPLLLMIVGSLVIVFLLGFVVPKFSMIYEGTSNELPYLSKLLLLWGQLLTKHGKLVLMLLTISFASLLFAFSKATVRSYFFAKLWQIPAIGRQLKIYQLARFYRTLGMLLKGGTPIIDALKSTSGLLDKSLQKNITKAELAISEGKQISEAMSFAGLTTPIANRMLSVGERGGNIDDMMPRIASFYDDELSRWLDWFTRLFEPILMLIIGLVIGVIVLLLYMPIFELAGNIQ